jgi:hypothetical protein
MFWRRLVYVPARENCSQRCGHRRRRQNDRGSQGSPCRTGRAPNCTFAVADAYDIKPDIGPNIANSWFDLDKVDVIVDEPHSGAALAVSGIARQKNRLFLASGAGTAELTGAKCNVNMIHSTYDTWNLANTAGKAIVKAGRLE